MLTFYDIGVIIYKKQIWGEIMPVRTETKFYRYVKLIDKGDMPAEQILKELKEQAEKLSVKGIKMKLLADDFFYGRAGNLFTSNIINGSITPYHNHDFYEINYVIEGECVQYVEGRDLIMKKGDLLLLPPDAFHAPCPVGDSKCVNILIRERFMKELEQRFGKCIKENYLTYLMKNKVYMLFKEVNEKEASKTADCLIKELASGVHFPPFDEVYTESLASKLIVELTECTRFDTIFWSESHDVGNDSPERILQYIRDNIAWVNLENASAHFGYTGAHLSRLVKKYTGNSFATFVNTQRILKAEYLLAKTGVPISTIPALVGLESKEYFGRMFKKVNGITPSEFRKKHKS